MIPIKVKLKVSEDKPIPFSIGSNNIPLSISLSAPIQKVMGDKYEGEYIVTPSSETQVLNTENLVMAQNLTINPIPSNYGLISWNGSTILVS